jgi:5'-deoxynucleotidase YfbR-like HD superfamily hydrolase
MSIAEIDTSLTAGEWVIGLSNGKFVDVSNLKPEDIDIESIAHSLSLQCRYMGHCKYHYSVAQHSVYVCDAIAREYGSPCRASFCGLLHDASEAFLHDIVRGIKCGLKIDGSHWIDIEAAVQKAIYRKFNLHDYAQYHDVVKKWDNRVFRSEAEVLMPDSQPWRDILSQVDPSGMQIGYMTPNVAKLDFLSRFETYTKLIETRGW